MFELQLKPTGRLYAAPMAFLAAVLFFGAALLAPARPLGYLSHSLATVYGATCVLMSWAGWKRFSELSSSLRTIQYAEAK